MRIVMRRIVRRCSILALGFAAGSLSRSAFAQRANGAVAQPAHPAPVATVIDARGAAGIYDVRAFGAVGDGKTIDSPAINKAIETAAAAGGGTVRFPAGVYLSYSIRLKSNITLYLDSGSKILAANRTIHGGDGYDPPEDIGEIKRYQDFGHSHWHNSLIWGENLTNVTITGPGMIDGGLYDANGVNNPAPVAGAPRGGRGTMGLTNGLRGAGGPANGVRPAGVAAGFGPARNRVNSFEAALAKLQAGDTAPETEPTTAPIDDNASSASGLPADGGAVRLARGPFSTDLSIPYTNRDILPAGVGNKSIALKLCRNVTLSDFSVLRGGHFAVLATGVDNLTFDNLKIDTNRDGFDIDGCRNVRISNCSVNSPYDDGIVLKSTWALGYGQSCENTTITNCMVCGGWETGSMLDGTYLERAPGTGRIKFGTESNAGFKNITISNCVFDRCQGLALETVDGAVIDNISISNITMRDIGTLPIFIRLGDRRRMPADKAAVGAIRHVNISDIVAQNRAAQYACEIVGIPGHEIEDVHISNVRIIWPGGAPAGIEKIVPPELPYQYPEPAMFGVMPAYGFYIRHVKGCSLNNIDMTCTNKDMRPPFALSDVQDADFFNINAQREDGVPMFMLNQVEQFRARAVRGMDDTSKDKVDSGTF